MNILIILSIMILISVLIAKRDRDIILNEEEEIRKEVNEIIHNLRKNEETDYTKIDDVEI